MNIIRFNSTRNIFDDTKLYSLLSEIVSIYYDMSAREHSDSETVSYESQVTSPVATQRSVNTLPC
jgi:hypothetical protein